MKKFQLILLITDPLSNWKSLFIFWKGQGEAVHPRRFVPLLRYSIFKNGHVVTKKKKTPCSDLTCTENQFIITSWNHESKLHWILWGLKILSPTCTVYMKVIYLLIKVYYVTLYDLIQIKSWPNSVTDCGMCSPCQFTPWKSFYSRPVIRKNKWTWGYKNISLWLLACFVKFSHCLYCVCIWVSYYLMPSSYWWHRFWMQNFWHYQTFVVS